MLNPNLFATRLRELYCMLKLENNPIMVSRHGGGFWSVLPSVHRVITETFSVLLWMHGGPSCPSFLPDFKLFLIKFSLSQLISVPFLGTLPSRILLLLYQIGLWDISWCYWNLGYSGAYQLLRIILAFPFYSLAWGTGPHVSLLLRSLDVFLASALGMEPGFCLFSGGPNVVEVSVPTVGS